MLPASILRRRVASQAWPPTRGRCSYVSQTRTRNGRERDKAAAAPRSAWKSKGEKGARNGDEGPTRGTSGNRAGPSKATTPSLIEQLFPERYAEGGTHRDQVRQVPFIEPEEIQTPRPETRLAPQHEEQSRQSIRAERLRRQMEKQPPNTAVLVLRNAGKNLTEEDFRRVIPQGKHLEGWTLEQGDILRTIPARDMETLEPNGSYFLLFSSPLSAFTYQGHVTRIHRTVMANTPSSLLSPIAPPPGYFVDGMDAHEAIHSYTLLSPDRTLELRQLKPPLAPALQSLVKHGGFEPLMKRRSRMRFEARLTLEGPQIPLPDIRHILRQSARHRGLSWSGIDDVLPKLEKWEPVPPSDLPSTANKKGSAMRWADRDERTSASSDTAKLEVQTDAFGDVSKGAPDPGDSKRRVPRPVYIAGFSTEQALHSFVHFWHGRPMAWDGSESSYEEDDVPPTAHVEVLW